jgi:pilus assembly protein CpaC
MPRSMTAARMERQDRMKNTPRNGHRHGRAVLFSALFAAFCLQPVLASGNTAMTVALGQSEVVDFDQPIRRVAISNPDIADATVISPTQILVDGKSSGVTTLIVWRESGGYEKYRLTVCSEAGARQISLRVRFMEINKTALKEFGSDFVVKYFKMGDERVDAGVYGGRVGEPSDPLALSNAVDFFFAIPNRNITAVFKALQDKNLLNVLAAPNLSAVSGAEASFLAGGEFPIPIVSGSMGTQTLTIQFKEYGVRLRFTPTVLDSMLVNIKVMAEVSSLDFENGILLSGFRIPSLSTRKTETTVELQEGQTLIIGGLLTKESSEVVSKIPVVGSIPVLGKLFSSQRYQNKESELLVTLSPNIMAPIPEGAAAPELEMRGSNEKTK